MPDRLRQRKEPDPAESTGETTLPSEDVSGTDEVQAKVNPLTGEAGYDEAYLGQKFVGVVVENQPAARPQWSMSTPDILIEYEVEGGISRMLWLYANQDRVPAKVGPVRSARHDIVELARGFDLIFVHCGGSPQALNKIKSYNGALSEIEGLTYAGCFERDQTRNVGLELRYLLLGDKFRASVVSLGIKTEQNPDYAHPFTFATDAPRVLTGSAAGKLHFEYSGAYKYDYTYNAETGKYEASLNGSPRVDDAGIRCAYENVVVLYTQMVRVGDSDGHQDLLLEKGGKGLYLSGGKMEEITWAKGNDTAPLKLLTADGAPLVLNVGKSYIGFVRSTNEGKTKVSE